MIPLQEVTSRISEVRLRLSDVKESQKPKGRALDLFFESNIYVDGSPRLLQYALTTYANFAEGALLGQPLTAGPPASELWYGVRNFKFKLNRGMLEYPSEFGRWCFDKQMCFFPVEAPLKAAAVKRVKQLVVKYPPLPDVFDLPPPERAAPPTGRKPSKLAGLRDGPASSGEGGAGEGNPGQLARLRADVAGMNPAQAEAVVHPGGPLLLLAGAGAGKTKTLTGLVGHLILERGVDPRSIFVATFTKKSGDELKERLEGYLPEGALEQMAIGTFHSICLKLILEEGRFRRLLGTDTDDTPASLVRRVIGRGVVEETGDRGMELEDADARQFTSFIGLLKNSLVKPSDVAAAREVADRAGLRLSSAALELLLDVYRMYEKLKLAKGVADFDDLLTGLWDRMQKVPAFREKLQRRFKWVLVDEGQDNCKAQLEIARAVAAPEDNLVLVGDDYQSIYSWRGARPEYMLDFEKMYPAARRLLLGVNYRSTPEIVALGSRIVAHNTKQLHKDISAARPSTGAVPEVFCGMDETGEAVEMVNLLRTRKYDVGGAAVLYRTNAQAAAVELALIRAQIPYVVEGGVGFFKRAEIQDTMAYLRLGGGATGRAADEAFKRIYNKPNRYLGKAFLDATLAAREPGQSLLAAAQSLKNARFTRGVDELARVLRAVSAAPDLRGKWTVVEDLYLDYLERLGTGEAEGDNDRKENLLALGTVISTFASAGGTFEQFLDFVEKAEKAAKTRKAAVRLMSIHRSKGLEFDVVFLIGVEKGILPHAMSRDVEEERRLFYVAVTRAKTHLHLSYRTAPSPFLSESGLLAPSAAPAPALPPPPPRA